MAPVLFDHRQQIFSQGGEEGIIDRVFKVVGEGDRFCCEFGAWDGIFLSNTRSLILRGWSALLIEGDRDKFVELEGNYADRSDVAAECSFIFSADDIASILDRRGLTKRLDLLSIDIDGLDYNIFATLDRLPALPRLVVVEVQPEHGYDRHELLPDHVARRNVGQPLAAFVRRGEQIGYRLVTYWGPNAFFLAEDAGGHAEIPTVTAEEAWKARWPASFPKDIARRR